MEWPWIQTLPGRVRYCLGLRHGATLASPNPSFHWSFGTAVGCPLSPSIRESFFLTSFFLPSPRAIISCIFAMMFVVLLLPQVFSSTELYFSAKHPPLCEPTLSHNTPWLCSHPPSVAPAFQVHFALNFPGSFYKEVFHRQKPAQNTVFIMGISTVIWKIYISGLLLLPCLTENQNKNHQGQDSNEIRILGIILVQ